MGVISSTALYLAAPSRVGGGPDTDGPVPLVTVPDAAPAAERSHPVAPVVFDLPASARVGGLDEAIAREIRRDGEAHRDAGVLAADVLSDAGERTGFAEAVVAAHDARIAFLRARIAAAATGDVAERGELDSLRLRLRRAEAARGLALARAGGASAAGRPTQDEPLPVARTSADARRVRPSAHPRALAGPARQPAPASAPPVPVASPRTVAAAGSLHFSRAVHGTRHEVRTGAAAPIAGGSPALATEPAVRPGPHRAGAASARVAHLLAAARRVLEADAAAPHLRVAGLLHWEGSETWSLPAAARTA